VSLMLERRNMERGLREIRNSTGAPCCRCTQVRWLLWESGPNGL